MFGRRRGGLIVLWCGGLGLLSILAEPAAMAATSVEGVSPRRESVQPYFITTGMAEAAQQIDLVARVNGYLREVLIDDGASVAAGDTLFVIEPEPYQASLQAAEAAQAKAQAQLEFDQAQYARKQTLRQRNSISQAELDSARASRDGAAADLASAKAEVAQARIELGYTRVKAPFSGAMTARQADEGAFVGPGQTEVLATLVQTDPIEVAFTVSESDVLELQQRLTESGMPPPGNEDISVDAGIGTGEAYPFAGHLVYRSPVADPDTGTFDMRASFANGQGLVSPGMDVRLRIPLGAARQHLVVPASAVGTDLQGRYVMKVVAGVVERVGVSVIEAWDSGLSLEGDIAARDTLVGNVQAAPAAGVRVEIRRAEDIDDAGSDD